MVARRSHTRTALLVAVLLAAAASPAVAESQANRSRAVIGSDFRISDAAATALDYLPAIAHNTTNNQYLVVWSDARDVDDRREDIYGRRFAATGRPLGSAFRISSPGDVDREFDPTVAYNAVNNQYLVVWSDDRDRDTKQLDVYGRRVKANGTPVGASFRISAADSDSSQASAWVAHNPDANQYLVVWADSRDRTTRGNDVYGRRIKANGTPVGGDIPISGIEATDHEHSPVVVYNPSSGKYLAAWQDHRDDATTGIGIYVRSVRAGGRPAGLDRRVATGGVANEEMTVALACNTTNNQFLVVWLDDRNEDTRGYDIYGLRLKATGAPAGVEFRITGAIGTADELHPVAGYNPGANAYLVGWTDYRNAPTRGSDVYARRVTSRGERPAGDFRVSGAGAIADDTYPAIAFNSVNGQFLVAWVDDRSLASRGTDVYGRRVDN